MSLHVQGEPADRFAERFTRRRFSEMRTCSAIIETDADWLSRMVPPPLEPVGTAIRVVTGSWNDEVVGAHTGGGLYVPARFGQLHGEFILRMYVDSELSLIVGRELFGEPKLLADEAEVFRDGETCHGYARRGATRLAVNGKIGDLEPKRGLTRRSFNLKAHLNVDARTVFGPPLLTATEWEQAEGRAAVGVGRVNLEGCLDVGHVPLRGSDRCPVTWAEGGMEGRTRVLAPVAEDHALPFVLARLGLDR